MEVLQGLRDSVIPNFARDITRTLFDFIFAVSHDTRELIDHTSFSIEPGIYAPDFGVRSETNVFVDGKNPVVVAGLQDEIIPILR